LIVDVQIIYLQICLTIQPAQVGNEAAAYVAHKVSEVIARELSNRGDPT